MDNLNDSMWAPMMGQYVYDKGKGENINAHGMGWWSFLMASWNALMLESVKGLLRSNHTPVLVIRGESDIIPEEIAREYISIFPNAKLMTIPKSGHLIGLEQPERLDSVIRIFLQESTDNTAHTSGDNGIGK